MHHLGISMYSVGTSVFAQQPGLLGTVSDRTELKRIDRRYYYVVV